MTPETGSQPSYIRIGVERARQLTRDIDMLVVDVRDARAFAAEHIASAVHVTSANLGRIIAQTPRSTPILIYCYHGHSSLTYAQTFADFGFREVYSLDGGYEAWRAAERAAVADSTTG